MNKATERNIRVQNRYDELMTIGEHGHYETMFRVVREETESLRQQLSAALVDADRYLWLRIRGLQRAWVSLGTDCDGENFADFKCEFKVPEPPNLPYEDDEGLEWADKDFDAAIDAAIAAAKEQK